MTKKIQTQYFVIVNNILILFTTSYMANCVCQIQFIPLSFFFFTLAVTSIFATRIIFTNVFFFNYFNFILCNLPGWVPHISSIF